MDVREKLVELLNEVQETGVNEIPAGFGCTRQYISNEMVAAHLISNGVTVQEWISVNDRLPIEEAKAHDQEWCEEYCEFLVMIERGLLPTTLYYDWEENEWFKINTALERETYKVTHWMPLPSTEGLE